MRVQHRPAQVGILEYLAYRRNVSTLGQPNPDGIAPKAFSIFIAPYENLRLHRLGTKLHQREKAMGSCTRDDLEKTIFLKLGKRPDNIPSNLIEVKVAGGKKPLRIETRQLIERRIAGCSFDLSAGELDDTVQITLCAMLEKWIPQHGTEGRSHRQSDSNRNALGGEASKNLQQRDVGLDNPFKEPILFMKLVMLRMSNEGEMRVEEESQ